MAYEEDFWISSKNEYVINSTKGEIDLTPIKNYKMYVILEIGFWFPVSEDIYEVGDIVPLSINGIDEWILRGTNRIDTKSGYYLIPTHPIEMEIDENTDIAVKAEDVRQSFLQEDNVYSAYFYNNSQYLDQIFGNETEKVNIFSQDYSGQYRNEGDKIVCGNYCYSYENGNLKNNQEYTIWTKDTSVSKTMGFRPVVTLKYGKGKEGRKIDNELEVGDYVKYSAQEYNSWRVLSIDNRENTVDIVSSGVVKNLTLTGKEGYDKIGELINNEVNKYKNGENVIKARSANKDDVPILNQMKNNFMVSFWTDDKKENATNGTISYDVGSVDYGAFSTGQSSSADASGVFKYIHLQLIDKGGERYGVIYPRTDNSYQYTAGIKPVITIKKDGLEKLSEDEIKKLDKSIIKYNKVVANEQVSKNKEYNDKYNANQEKDFTSSTPYNNQDNMNSINNIKDSIDNKLLKIIIGILTVISISMIAQTVINVLILKNIKK